MGSSGFGPREVGEFPHRKPLTTTFPESAVSRRAIQVDSSVHKRLRAHDGKAVAKTQNSRFPIVNPMVAEAKETFSEDASSLLTK